jgi:flagellar basal body-associated protein FliL
MIHFNCPHCRKSLKAENDRIGKLTRCPKCRSPIEVPRSLGEMVPADPPGSSELIPFSEPPVPDRVETGSNVEEPSLPAPVFDEWDPAPQSESKAGMLVVSLGIVACVVMAVVIIIAVASSQKDGQQAARKPEKAKVAARQQLPSDDQRMWQPPRRDEQKPPPRFVPKEEPELEVREPQPPLEVPRQARPPALRFNPEVEGGLRLRMYGNLSRSDWEALKPEEKREVLIKMVEKDEAAALQEFEDAKKRYRASLSQIPIPPQSEAVAAQLQSQLTPIGEDIRENLNVQGRYVSYYVQSYGPDRQAIQAATQAIYKSASVVEQIAKTQRDLNLLSEEYREASMKNAKGITKLEQERREAMNQFPKDGDTRFVRHKEQLLTEGELQIVRSYEKEHGSPRAAADSYVLSLESLRLWKPAWKATYNHSHRDDLVAVYYVTDKPDARHHLHAYLCKTIEGLWFVVPQQGKADNLNAGKPASIFKPE